MRPRLWSGDELLAAVLAPGEPEVAGELIVVGAPTSDLDPSRFSAAVERLGALPCVVVGAPGWPNAGWSAPGGADDLVDLIAVTDADVDDVGATFERAPLAAASLALHLRATDRRSVVDGLVAESALYSALQAGPEHRAWREATPARDRGDQGEARLRVERHGDQLHVTLHRPAARNALDAAMRDELIAALAIAEADPSLRVVIGGDGPAFCAGGDLDAFGTTPDPATAHVVRLERSIGAAIHRLADRTTVRLQGPCAGSGVELAAFAGRVVAHPNTMLALPELGLGLIPGAGGTVSIPARIGRHRTAWLALTGRSIDADTAQRWGLVDEIILI